MVLIFDMANDKYREFINLLRDKVRDPDIFSHGCPVLPLDRNAYIDVNLQDGSLDKGTVRIGRHDLRLICYQKPDGNWLDLNDFELYDHNSRLLEVGNVRCLGPITLVEAVNYLADPERLLTDVKEKEGVKLSLLVLCVVLCEATKLDILMNLFAAAFELHFEVPLHSIMLKFMDDWESLSTELLGPDHADDKDCCYYLSNPDNDWHKYWRRVIGVTCQDVARCLGILRRIPPSIDDLSNEPKGTCLAEIFSVRVYIDGGRNGYIYGKVKVKDGFHTYVIYNRDATECEELTESDDTLSLEGPRGFVVSDDVVEVEVDLIERDDGLQVSKGTMYWSSYVVDAEGDAIYDARHSVLIRGVNGYAIVFYTVFEKAVQAVVEVTLVTDECDIADSFCGSLFASYTEFSYCTDHLRKYYRIKLFDKPVPTAKMDLGECKRVKKTMCCIELQRPVVTVPVYSSLVLEASLTNRTGNPILMGSLTMPTREVGTFADVIGRRDKTHLLVKVTWNKYNYGCP